MNAEPALIPSQTRSRFIGRRVIALTLGLGALLLNPSALTTPRPALGAEPSGKLERTHLKIALPARAIGPLPTFVAAERFFREEGLTVDLVIVTGEGVAAQALASNSVDINITNLNSLINMLVAGHRVMGFYAGWSHADFEWFTRPEIRSWPELYNRSIGIATYGSLLDVFTRYVLRKHGLDPDRDVRIVQVGSSVNALHALKVGRVDAAILAPPLTWQAEASGFARLGTQAKEVGDEWPRNIFYAKDRFLDANPHAIRALLRAHVKAVRSIRQDREATVKTIMNALKYERPHAERLYGAIAPHFHERGVPRPRTMSVFWEVTIASGEVKESLPEAVFFDRRFADTFDEWAPK